MKSWADHSDSEDEDYEFTTSTTSNNNIAPAETEDLESEEHDDEDIEKDEPPPKKEFDLPSQPPYTAFIGNLAPVAEEGDIMDAIADAQARLEDEGGDPQPPIKVDKVRLMSDRDTGKRKGYGYVEVQTLEDLKALLAFNEDLIVKGRQLRLDVAAQKQQRRSNKGNRGFGYGYSNRNGKGGGPDIDGRKFRGGLHGKNENGDRDRPTVRTKIVIKSAKDDGAPGSESNESRSSIFGGGKPRDASSLQKSLKKNVDRSDYNRQSHSGRGNGRDRDRDRNRTRGKHRSGGNGRGGPVNKQEPKPLPTIQPEPKSNVPKTTNKFAALGFDSDSD